MKPGRLQRVPGACARGGALLALLLAVPVQASEGSLRLGRRLVPAPKPHHETGEPQHDDVFYKEDYPHDHQPRVLKHMKFEHPYPDLQDSDTFDADYPKDENHDNGEYQAQMDFDHARNLLAKRRHDAAKAKQAKDFHQRELDEARRQQGLIHGQTEHAVKRVREARESLAEATEELRHVQGHGDSITGDAELDAAIDEVAQASEHVDDCEEQLEQARDMLEKVMANAADADKERMRRLLDRSGDVLASHSAVNRSMSTEQRLEFVKQRAQERVAKGEEEREDAVQRYEKAVAERKEAQEKFHRAQDNLRRFGRKMPEHDGGPSAQLEERELEQELHHHSGAARPAALLAATLALLAPWAAGLGL